MVLNQWIVETGFKQDEIKKNNEKINKNLILIFYHHEHIHHLLG
jgi:hypothetical protein